MNPRRVVCAGLVLLALALVVPAAARVAPEPNEFLVHRSEGSTLSTPQAAFGPGGISLVVWTDARAGIRGQLYDRDGSALGAAVDLVSNRLPATIPGEGFSVLHQEPTAAFLPNGDFLLAWTAETGYLRVAPFFQHFEVAARRVVAQRFHAWGEPAGRIFAFAPATGAQSWPALAVLERGGVLALWHDDQEGLLVRRLNRAGRPLDDVLRVSAPDDAQARNAVLAAGADGNVLVAWEGCCDAGADLGVFGRLYDRRSGTVGDLLQLNDDPAGRQRRPAIAAAGDRGYFVVYQSELERSLIPIFGRFVDLQGQPASHEVQVSHGFDTVQLAPAVAPTPDGGFLAIWRDWLGASFGITAVELAADGTPVGPEVRVNDERIKKAGHTSLATDGAGSFLIPWDAQVRGNQQIGARRLHGR